MNAGRWPSPLDAATVAAAGLRLAQPARHGGWTYWLEGRPNEGGRIALLRVSDTALIQGDDAPREELAPAPLSVRTRVHEYGGGAYLACDAGVFFVAEGVLEDGRGASAPDAEAALWWLEPDGTLTLLAAPVGQRIADLCWDPHRARLLCVVEDRRRDPHRPRHLIGAIALAGARGALTELVSGRDFYASPRLAPDGGTLAYLAWDLPEMPWDGASLHAAALDAAGAAAPPLVLAGPAVFQPGFAPDGALWWSDDANGRFVLARARDPAHCVALDDPARLEVERFPDGARECALPLWNLNMRSFAVVDARTVVAASVAEGLWSLRALDLRSGAWRMLADDLTQLDHVEAADGMAVVLGGGPRETLGVQLIDLAHQRRRTLVRAGALALDPRLFAAPEPVRFAGADGATVHALWWPPASADQALAPAELPPLLLRCHGGPTAAAQSALDGRWGELDAADAVAAARWASASGRADPARIAITGSSAGGLTALNALALPDAPFRSAAIHYGLAELVSAMTDTHKFEAGYGESLLGPWPAARAVYEARSPLTRLLGAADGARYGWPPTILFQGAADSVVVPDQSARLAEALRARGVPVELRVYPGEGHGFRRATTIVDVLEAELAFHLAAGERAA